MPILHECETWSFTLREESRLRVFENRVLRRIFRPKRDEVTGEWRRLHNGKLYALYSSPNIIQGIKSRRMALTRHVARMGERRGAYRVWWGNLRDGDHLEDPGVDGRIIFKVDFRQVGWVMDWIDLAQDRDRWRALVNAAMNIRVP